MKRVVSIVLLLLLLPALPAAAHGTGAGGGLTVSAPCAVLMEKETGTVLFEKNARDTGFPASVPRS